MSVQIAVRLPESLVESVDALVASGEEKSRASVVERALQRELRRMRMIEEVQILNSAEGVDEDLGSLTAHASRTPLELP
jgi:Arc/MetJ-type ribon-helix-helix transcriptional regulator